jgi:amino acid transporter
VQVRSLTAFDLTTLVIGAVVGADIYVAANLTTPLVGASSLLLWLLAGAVAFIIALSFSACAQMTPSEGGAYAYARDAFGERTGFLVGWAMLLSQFLGAAVFPTAFVQYLHGFVEMPLWADVLAKAAFIALVLALNLVPAKTASRLGALLGFLKLAPLLLVIALGVHAWAHAPAEAASHFDPVVAGGPLQFATAFMIIFWAYTGFEVATLPAAEVRNPRRSIPVAIAVGLAFSLLVYLLVNGALLAILPQSSIASESAPLVEAARVAVGSFLPGAASAAAAFLGIGALLAILGADQANMMGASRLAHALAADGYLPPSLGKLTPSGVPLRALVTLGVLAFAATLVGGLTLLIGASVVFVAITFFTTAVASWRLAQKDPFHKLRSPILPALGALSAIVLILASGWQAMLIGALVMALGFPLFAHYAPKRRNHGLRDMLRHRHPTVQSVADRTDGLFWRVAWWVAKKRHGARIPTRARVTAPWKPRAP